MSSNHPKKGVNIKFSGMFLQNLFHYSTICIVRSVLFIQSCVSRVLHRVWHTIQYNILCTTPCTHHVLWSLYYIILIYHIDSSEIRKWKTWLNAVTVMWVSFTHIKYGVSFHYRIKFCITSPIIKMNINMVGVKLFFWFYITNASNCICIICSCLNNPGFNKSL